MEEYSLVTRGMNPIQYWKTTAILTLAFSAQGEHDDYHRARFQQNQPSLHRRRRDYGKHQ